MDFLYCWLIQSMATRWNSCASTLDLAQFISFHLHHLVSTKYAIYSKLSDQVKF